MQNSLTGLLGEELAAQYLRTEKYIVLDNSYRSKYGEIDIIAKKKNLIVFVEVKTRKNDNFAKALENVDYRKQEKIKLTASLWMAENDNNFDYRFDVVEVYLDANIINHIENAF